MAIHRDQRRADVRDVLDEFEEWLLRERSAQERATARCSATRQQPGCQKRHDHADTRWRRPPLRHYALSVRSSAGNSAAMTGKSAILT